MNILDNIMIKELMRAAEVAKIALEEDDLKRLQARFTAYLQWLEPLLEADCAACEPLLFGHGALIVMREDKAEQCELKDLSYSAANFEDGYYVVPPIIE